MVLNENDKIFCKTHRIMEKEGNIEQCRLLYIDYIKALGICLVILYHCQYVPFDSLLIQGLYSICVPLFFVVNGSLMLRKEYTISYLLKKNLKLSLVMFFWAFFSTLVYWYVSKDGNIVDIYNCKWEFIRSALVIQKPECNYLWFLKAIFVLNLLNPIIYRFIQSCKGGLVYGIILLGLWTIAFLDIITCRFANPFVHWTTAFSVLYYILGYGVLSKQLPFVEKFKGKLGIWMLFGIIGISALLQRWYNWSFLDGIFADLNQQKGWIIDVVYDNYNAIFIVVITIAICLLFQRINWKEHKFWKFIGQHSLAIYLLQTPVQRLIQYFLPLQELTQIHKCYAVLLPIFTLLICMLVTKLLLTNKYTTYLITI